MDEELFDVPLNWSLDLSSIYIPLHGTNAYLQVTCLDGVHPLLNAYAFHPEARPTIKDLLHAIPEINNLSWQLEPKGSFPSVELHAFLNGLRIAIIGVASRDTTIAAEVRVRQKFAELARIGERLQYHASAAT